MKFISICLFLFVAAPLTSFGKIHKIQPLNKKDNQTMLFDPTFIKIKVGDTVNFIPKSKGHTSQSVLLPKNARSWKGETSKEISVDFKEEGIYIYECQNHGIMGMAGIIQVGEAKNLNEAKKFYKDYKKKFIMHQNRLDEYFERIQ